MKFSDGNPKTLEGAMTFAVKLWGRGSKQARYLERLIDESPHGKQTPVNIPEERLAFILLNLPEEEGVRSEK